MGFDGTPRNMNRGRFVLICAVLLAGCARMSDIETHEKMLDAQRLDQGKAIAKADPIPWPDEKWWKAYRDAQLDALVEHGIADSPTLGSARARIAQSQALADRMHAATKPAIGVDASAMRERYTAQQFIPPPWGGTVSWDNQAQLTFAYDLDIWGRQKSLWQSSMDEARAVAAEAQMVRLELITAIVRSYVMLALEYDLRDLAMKEQAEIEQRIAIDKRSLMSGMGTEMELAEAETHLPEARLKIEALDMRIALMKNQIAALSGQGPGAGEKLVRPELKLDARSGLPDRLMANLIGRRPDVLAYRWRVEAARNGIESAKAAFYPNINLLAFAGVQALGFNQLLGASAAMAGVGPAISLPIFDGGARRAHLSEKTAAYDVAVDDYNERVLRSLQEISDQLHVLQSNAVQRSEAKGALGLAQKKHELAEAGYRAGLADYAHVIDADVAVLQHQAMLATLEAEGFDAYAGLMRSLGGGIREDK